MGFNIVDGQLAFVRENKTLLLADVVKGVGQPIYAYDLCGMVDRLKVYQTHFGKNTHVHYAVKANDHPKILKAFAEAGAGADVVSGGELNKAIAAGFANKDIVFSGVGKTVSELKLAISHDIKQINVESPQELERVAEVASSLGKKAPVAFRMNPDVDAQTHPYIKTGFRENKFGMDRSFCQSWNGLYWQTNPQ